jgi:hypothetical protein
MLKNYAEYTNISVSALTFNPKSHDSIQKKQEIVDIVSQHYKSTPTSILFVGFSPLILSATYKQIFVTGITNQTKNFLDTNNVKYVYINDVDLLKYKKQFDWVVAGDEYFTFATSEEEQRNNIELMSSLAKNLIVTTLRDYKNQEFKEREFSLPLTVHNHKDHKIFLEYHNYDYNDKNAWTTSVYELQGDSNVRYGPFARRSMFFKQMAKFSIDAGAKNFYVHKNLMYKSLIKKNYEHVISIEF